MKTSQAFQRYQCHQRRALLYAEQRRFIDNLLCHWVGLRQARGQNTCDEFEELQECHSAGDYIRFYLQRTRPVDHWESWTPRQKWHWFRLNASSFYCHGGGAMKSLEDRDTFYERLLNFMENDLAHLRSYPYCRLP